MTALTAILLCLAASATSAIVPRPPWLGEKWYRIARCETGVNWHHANRQFVSAFGISRAEYDRDARLMGAPPWDDRKHPTPRQQFAAAKGHYRLHGGFSGWGCRGA